MSVVIKLDEKLVAKIDKVAKDSNQNRLQYINSALQKALQDNTLQKQQSDEEKVKRFLESYEKKPLQPEEHEVWLDEQVWEDK